MLSCLEILLLFKKVFLIMLINFFGDDFGIAFELIWGFPSFFFFLLLWLQEYPNNSRVRRMQAAWTWGEGRLQPGGRGGGLQWRPRQSRHPPTTASWRPVSQGPCCSRVWLWEAQGAWFWRCGNWSPVLRTGCFRTISGSQNWNILLSTDRIQPKKKCIYLFLKLGSSPKNL